MSKKKRPEADVIVAQIALYGTSRHGHGYIATAVIKGERKMFGDGEPREGRSATDALFLAIDDLETNGIRGRVSVHIDLSRGDGIKIPRVAFMSTQSPVYFGELEWQDAAPAVVISAEELMAAGEAVGA